MKIIALNIETMANLDMIDQIEEVDVRLGNIKDPVKIAEKREAAQAKAASRMALDPFFGRILCVTACARKDDGIKALTVFPHETEGGGDAGERAVLNWTWNVLANKGEDARLVTFNGAAFDVPFLQVRSLLLGVRASVIECNQYRVNSFDSTHCDLYKVFDRIGNPGDMSRRLPFFVKQLLREDWPYSDVDQSKLGKLLQDGGRDRIKMLCEWNATRTLALYEAASKYLAW